MKYWVVWGNGNLKLSAGVSDGPFDTHKEAKAKADERLDAEDNPAVGYWVERECSVCQQVGLESCHWTCE